MSLPCAKIYVPRVQAAVISNNEKAEEDCRCQAKDSMLSTFDRTNEWQSILLFTDNPIYF